MGDEALLSVLPGISIRILEEINSAPERASRAHLLTFEGVLRTCWERDILPLSHRYPSQINKTSYARLRTGQVLSGPPFLLLLLGIDAFFEGLDKVLTFSPVLGLIHTFLPSRPSLKPQTKTRVVKGHNM